MSIVAVGNLTPAQIAQYGEYAPAVAAQPILGKAGFILIGIAALFSTASAINATLFGMARLSHAMARQRELPRPFLMRSRKNILWVALLVITLATLVFVNMANLDIIASFASSTFLLLFAAVNAAALKLHRQIRLHWFWPLVGVLGALAAWVILMTHLYDTQRESLYRLLLFYVAVSIVEWLFSQRGLLHRRAA